MYCHEFIDYVIFHFMNNNDLIGISLVDFHLIIFYYIE